MEHYAPPSSQEGRNFCRGGKCLLGSFNIYKVACLTAPPITSPYFRQGYIALIAAIFLLSLSIQASAQQKLPSTREIVERLNSLERENRNLREDVAEVKDENDDLKASLKEYEPFKHWAGILTALGVVNIFGVLLLYFKVIPTKVNSQLDAIITKMLTDRRKDFLGILKEYDFENSVKERHRVVLLSHRNGSDDYHHRMLTKNGFNVHPLTKLEQLQDAEFSADDILVINNDGNHWPTEQVQAFVNAQHNYCFYFGKGVIIPEPNRMDRFAAANFRTRSYVCSFSINAPLAPVTILPALHDEIDNFC